MGAEVRGLRGAIRAMEQVVERDGPSRFTMTGLARLPGLRPFALAGTGACSDALVEIAKAIDYDGSDAKLQCTQRQLTFQMESIRREAAGIKHVDPRVNPEHLV